MPGRSYTAGNGYRYGFNGKEMDNEPYGQGNEYDYGFRIYNPRIGRFLSIDPLFPKYPWYTPYQFAGNKPIWAIDVDGLEEYIKTYKYEDGKATLLSVTKNSYLEKVDLRPCNQCNHDYNMVVYDKRTNKPMNAAEIGQVQYQYVDNDGNKLNIRRDYTGKYVSGANEMMPLGENNLMGSIYIGGNNPTYKDANGKTQYDYRREPQDEMDAGAMEHDMDYDKARAAGKKDALFNRDVIPADKKLVTAATVVEQKGKIGGVDNMTGKPVSSQTQTRAKLVRIFFNYILNAGAFKGDPPKEPEHGPVPVIK